MRVHYPPGAGRIRLRCDRDWDAPIEPTLDVRAAGFADFHVPLARRHGYFKPVLHDGAAVRWAQGPDLLAVAGERLDVHPFFHPPDASGGPERHRVACARSGREHTVHVLLPPGYDERRLALYPVLYMQDGSNLFAASEAFSGQHWRVPESLQTLRAMDAVRDCIVVGIEPRLRDDDYTAPGYRAYGEFVVDVLKPWIDARYRTLRGPEHTAVMGSSLGGVVSLFLGLRWPEVFGGVACMSSTFGWRDDLTQVLGERLPARIYLDSGWPDDNFEVTRAMADTLRRGGLGDTRLLYLSFPHARHSESAWAQRLHVPLQFLLGRAAGVPASGDAGPDSVSRRAGGVHVAA